MTNGLDQWDLKVLRRTQSLHMLGRLASSFEATRGHIVTSIQGGSGGELDYQYGPKGLDVWTDDDNMFTDAPTRRITWAQVRNHVDRYATDTFRDAFLANDKQWCRAATAHHANNGQHRARTEEQRAEIQRLERQIAYLARPIWDPAQTVDIEAAQLSLFP